MADTQPQIVPADLVLGDNEGTTEPEWGTRVSHILEGDDQPPEKIKRPEGTFLSKCKICMNTPESAFAVVAGADKYQYYCTRCGNVGDIFPSEFAARQRWNMNNAVQARKGSAQAEVAHELATINANLADLYSIRAQLEHMVSGMRDHQEQLKEFLTILENVTNSKWGDEAAFKMKVDAAQLTGTLSSDIPETIRIVNSSHNETARTVGMGFDDVSRSINTLAAAISSMNISNK